MPTTLSMTHDFSASAERVFAAFSDHANMHRWFGVKVTLVHDVPGGGTGSVRRVHLGPRSFDEEVLESEANRRIVYKIVRNLAPLDHHRGEIRFTELDPSSVRVDWQIELGSKVPLLVGIVGAVLKLAINRALARLDGQLKRTSA
jgi:uncharacterized protein YndB with AHSA1/START domain